MYGIIQNHLFTNGNAYCVVYCDEMIIQCIKGLIGELDVWFIDKSMLDAMVLFIPNMGCK
jgi:hypothetical protein